MNKLRMKMILLVLMFVILQKILSKDFLKTVKKILTNLKNILKIITIQFKNRKSIVVDNKKILNLEIIINKKPVKHVLIFKTNYKIRNKIC